MKRGYVVCPACAGWQRARVEQGQIIYTGEPCKLCQAKGTVTKKEAAAYQEAPKND